MRRLSGRMVLVVLGVLTVRLPGWAADRAGDMVREDWYCRESLAAIRDWEAVLARWEEATPEAQRTPVLPVPAGGEVVAWPNPIPRTLLPAEDRSLRVRVSMVGGKVKIERGASEKGDRSNLCEAPSGPFRQIGPVPFFAPGETILGYKHPGGGGKDQWYHRYERRFDRLTTFQAKPARFGLRIDAPLDLRRGANELVVSFSSGTPEPLALTATLELHLPEGMRAGGQQTIELAPGATQPATFSVSLDRPGGGLLILTIADGNESFWLPLFAHVEDVASVLASVEQILADAPDEAAAAQFRRVRETHRLLCKPEEWCVSRTLHASRRGERVRRWVSLRKGVADITRRAEICRAAKDRYLEALGVVGEPSPTRQLLNPVSKRIVRDGRPYRALRPIEPEESRLFRVLLDGKFLLQGFRNKGVRRAMHPAAESRPATRRQASARVTRLLRLLRAHGLVRKVSHTLYYRVTNRGQHVLTTALRLREIDIAALAV